MRSFAADGAREATLGLSPLSQNGSPGQGFGPGAVGRVLRLMRARGNAYCNFKGIEQFKAKLRPDEWRPTYAVIPGEWTLGDLGSLVEAFTGKTPAQFAPSLLSARRQINCRP